MNPRKASRGIKTAAEEHSAIQNHSLWTVCSEAVILIFLLPTLAASSCKISSSKHFAVNGQEVTTEDSRSAAPPDSESAVYKYSTEETACYELGPKGLVPALRDKTAAEQGTELGEAHTAGEAAKVSEAGTELSAMAPRVAAVTAADGALSMAAIALNRFGYAFLEVSPDGLKYRIRSFSLTASKFLSTANMWPWENGFLLELYRDPFSATSDVSRSVFEVPTISSAGQELYAIDAQSGLSRSLPRIGSGREELFALQPSSGLWYAEMREEPTSGRDSVKLSYYALSSPELHSAGTELQAGKAEQFSRFTLSRDKFEKTIAPQALANAPKALKLVAEAAAEGTLLIHQKGGPEIESYWLRGKSLVDARTASAWVSIDGQKAVLLEENGGVISALNGPGSIQHFRINLPLDGLRFTSLAIIETGRRSLLVASYESGKFTKIDRSGIVVLPLLK